MRRVTSRDLEYAWRDASGALALPGDGVSAPAAGLGSLSFSREIAVPQLGGASASFETEVLSWSGGLRRNPLPKGALYIPSVEIFGGLSYCSTPSPTSPNGALVDLIILTAGPAGTKNCFRWVGLIAALNGALTKTVGSIGAYDNGVHSYLRAGERTSVRFRIEFSAGSPANAALNAGAYRVVATAIEV
jgi:hypothetical protein